MATPFQVPLSVLEWLAVVLAIAGTVGLGMFSANDEESKPEEIDYGVLLRLGIALAVYCKLEGAGYGLRERFGLLWAVVP